MKKVPNKRLVSFFLPQAQFRKKDESAINFDMDATTIQNKKNSWVSSIFSITQIIFYGTLTVVTLIIIFIINC